MPGDTVTGDGSAPPQGAPREPSLLDAVLPVVVLIVLIATTIALFGVGATDGPLQVALLLSAAFASLIAFKNGYTVESVAQAIVEGVSTAMGAIFILLAVGALIGTWNMAGTIPTVVTYGIGIMSPTWFYLATVVICALVGVVTGSSWTTAGTLGVAFVAMASVLGLSTAIAAGAVICGAYFGDKMTPLSETTILVPSLVGGGLTVGTHIRNMAWTAVPALGISCLIFLILGLQAVPEGGADPDEAVAILEGLFNISPVALLPLVVLVAFSLFKAPPFLSILGSAVFAGVLALITQTELVESFVGDPELGPAATGLHAIYASMATGFVSVTGNETIDSLFSRGGMAGLLTTVWLVIAALSFAAIMERRVSPSHPDTRSSSYPDAGQSHPRSQRQWGRSQRGRGRPVCRRRASGTDVQWRVRKTGTRPPGAFQGGRGLRHGDLGVGSLEHVRGIHLRSSRGSYRRLYAVLLLQLAQPSSRHPLRLYRVQGPTASAWQWRRVWMTVMESDRYIYAGSW